MIFELMGINKFSIIFQIIKDPIKAKKPLGFAFFEIQQG